MLKSDLKLTLNSTPNKDSQHLLRRTEGSDGWIFGKHDFIYGIGKDNEFYEITNILGAMLEHFLTMGSNLT